MKKKLTYIIIFTTILFITFFVIKQKNRQIGINNTKLQVCIMQIAPHPSLDKIKQGIEHALQQSPLSKKIDIKFQNAQGNPALSTQIAQQFVSTKADIIIPITTLCALNAYQAAHPQHIPVVFSAVTDPKSCKLSLDNKQSIEGITGISDFMNPEIQIQFLKDLFNGKKYKKIGTLYNIGEQNTVTQIEEFEKKLTNTDFSLKKIPVHQTIDINQAALKLCESCDFILILNDNMVVSSMPQILQIAKEKKIPVIATDPESVDLGALAALAFDQFEIGKQTGELALKVLEGKKPESFNIEGAKVLNIYFNEEVAKTFDIKKPQQQENIKIIMRGEKS